MIARNTPYSSQNKSRLRNQRTSRQQACRTAYLRRCHWIRTRFGRSGSLLPLIRSRGQRRTKKHRVHPQTDCDWQNLERVANNYLEWQKPLASKQDCIAGDQTQTNDMRDALPLLAMMISLKLPSCVLQLRNAGQLPEFSNAKTDFDFKHTMPDVSIFADMCYGCVLLGTDQPVHRIAFLEVGIRVAAKLAVASCTGVLQRSEVKTFHEGLPDWIITLPYTSRGSSARCRPCSPADGEHKAKLLDCFPWMNAANA
jgi:hypothetical protein